MTVIVKDLSSWRSSRGFGFAETVVREFGLADQVLWGADGVGGGGGVVGWSALSARLGLGEQEAVDRLFGREFAVFLEVSGDVSVAAGVAVDDARVNWSGLLKSWAVASLVDRQTEMSMIERLVAHPRRTVMSRPVYSMEKGEYEVVFVRGAGTGGGGVGGGGGGDVWMVMGPARSSVLLERIARRCAAGDRGFSRWIAERAGDAHAVFEVERAAGGGDRYAARFGDDEIRVDFAGSLPIEFVDAGVDASRALGVLPGVLDVVGDDPRVLVAIAESRQPEVAEKKRRTGEHDGAGVEAEVEDPFVSVLRTLGGEDLDLALARRHVLLATRPAGEGGRGVLVTMGMESVDGRRSIAAIDDVVANVLSRVDEVVSGVGDADSAVGRTSFDGRLWMAPRREVVSLPVFVPAALSPVEVVWYVLRGDGVGGSGGGGGGVGGATTKSDWVVVTLAVGAGSGDEAVASAREPSGLLRRVIAGVGAEQAGGGGRTAGGDGGGVGDTGGVGGGRTISVGVVRAGLAAETLTSMATLPVPGLSKVLRVVGGVEALRWKIDLEASRVVGTVRIGLSE